MLLHAGQNHHAMVYGFARQVAGFVELHSAPGLGPLASFFFPEPAKSDAGTCPSHNRPRTGGRRCFWSRTKSRCARSSRGYSGATGTMFWKRATARARGSGTWSSNRSADFGCGDARRDERAQGRGGGSHPEARLLYISGYPGDALAPHGGRPQQLNFLHKPFTQDALARKVREMLAADESSQLK